MMVSAGISQDVVNAAEGAFARILRSIDDTIDPGQEERACAHGAGLKGGVEGATLEAP
jgi:hypothetical protein